MKLSQNPVSDFRGEVLVKLLTDDGQMAVSIKSNDNRFVHNKLMKGKALRKHSLHEKTAASVLLKLFISGMNDYHKLLYNCIIVFQVHI